MKKIVSHIPSNVLIFLALFFLGLLNFADNLRGDFMIDDYDLVLSQPVLGHKVIDIQKDVYYRPLAQIIPQLQFLLFGPYPLGYHLSNLIFFTLACLCFYKLLLELDASRRVAWLGAVLFCLHPLNALMVNYITASVFAFQIIFLSLSVLYYLRAKKSITFRWISACMFVLALFCHETSIMLPAYFFLISWYQGHKLKRNLKKVFPFVILAASYLLARFYFNSLHESLTSKISLVSSLNIATYAATIVKLLSWYLEKFFMLQPAVIFYSTFPVVKGAVFWILGGLLMAGLLAYLLFQWRRNIKSLFTTWFLLGIPPVLAGCFFNPSSGLMIEPHWLYFASFGLFALFAMALSKLADAIAPRWRSGLIAAVCVVFVIAAWNNNRVWRSELTMSAYWNETVVENKNVSFFYANALMKNGHTLQAKQWFLRSIDNQQHDWQIYNNLAQIELAHGKEEQAKIYYEKALEVYPQSSVVHNNLGVYFLQRRDWKNAEEHFRFAHLFNPSYVETLLNMSLLYEQKMDWSSLWEQLLKAYELRPHDERVLAGILRTALKGHGGKDFIARAPEFLNDIENSQVLFEIGLLLEKRGKKDIAALYFSKASVLQKQSKSKF